MPHRYRTQHVDEDAADGSDMIVATGYGDRWCDWCGQYQEADGWDYCGFCTRPLGQHGWVCTACAHRNPDDARSCESCGRRRAA